MSLDPMPDVETLLRMKAERERRPYTKQTARLARKTTPEGPLEAPAAPLYTNPVRLRLPWSCLISDNQKHVAFLRAGKPAMKITREYATAKDRIAAYAKDVMGETPPFDCPLSLTARVWYPNKAGRDLTNWCKLVHDALNGVAYTDDSLLRDVRWIYAGIDIDAPRADITLTPISSEAAA